MDMTLFSLLAGGAITLITQVVKRLVPEVSPLAIAAGLSVAGGIGFVLLSQYGLWEVFKDNVLVAFSASIAIYEVLKTLQILHPAT